MQVFSDDVVSLVSRGSAAKSEVVAPISKSGSAKEASAPADQTAIQSTPLKETASPATPPPTPEVVAEAVDNINQALAISQRSVRLKSSDYAETAVVEVIDKETEQVIRQIPQESTLKLVEYWSQNGLLAEDGFTALSVDETA